MKTLGILVLGALLVTGCLSDDTSERTYDLKEITELRQEIIDLANSSVCTDETECAHVAFGSKPCGGPWEYLVYSTSINVDAFLAKVEAYNKIEKEYNDKYGIVSDCMLVVPPTELICEDGKCVGTYPQYQQ